MASFNLRYGTAEDGEHAWPHRKQAALETIVGLGPDILCLQEALDFQIHEIASALPNYRYFATGRDDGLSEGEHCPVFWDPDRLHRVDAGTFWFSDSPGVAGSRHPECFHPRICTWVSFDEGFTVYNAHLDNESALARDQAVHQLQSTVRSPAIVAGDFNAGEGDRCVASMRSGGFSDTFRTIHPLEAMASTYHGFTGSSTGDKIDYIWVDPAWEVLGAEIVRTAPGGVLPSDHYPITATIRLPD